MLNAWDVFYKYKYLIYVLVSRDIKKKYRRSVLGILWSMLNPLCMMLIISMVFSTIFRFDVENYILYLLIGQTTFHFYSEAVSFALGSILENKALIKKIYVPKYMFPLSRVLSSCVNLVLTIPAVLFMMIYTGQWPDIKVISIVIPLVLMLVFCLGIGLFLSSVVVYFRDVFHLHTVLMTGLMYATPIFYPESIVPEEYRFIQLLNPLYYYVKSFREVFYMGGVPSLDNTMICVGISVVSIVTGVTVFRKLQDKFILYM